jgi:hypothetical protein
MFLLIALVCFAFWVTYQAGVRAGRARARDVR